MIAATIWLVGALVANVAGPTKKVTTVRSTKRSPANPESLPLPVCHRHTPGIVASPIDYLPGAGPRLR
jgi:hypothetical protein